MDPKTISLLKKHIRMLDYIRADLVAILGQQPETPGKLPTSPSSLYAEFDAALSTLEPYVRPVDPVAVAMLDEHGLDDVKITIQPTLDVDPEAHQDAPHVPKPRPLNEYEVRKAELHAQRVTPCIADRDPYCPCPRCHGRMA